MVIKWEIQSRITAQKRFLPILPRNCIFSILLTKYTSFRRERKQIETHFKVTVRDSGIMD